MLAFNDLSPEIRVPTEAKLAAKFEVEVEVKLEKRLDELDEDEELSRERV